MIWKACYRMGIRPPGVEDTWDKCDVATQAMLIVFDEVLTRREEDILDAQSGNPSQAI